MEGFIDKRYLTEHPKGKIRLLDDTLLDGDRKGINVGRTDDFSEYEFDDYLFVENAHRLFIDRSIVLSDSRMFLAPVRVKNHIAYTGYHGFRNATLGVYLEWWKTCKYSRIDNPGGTFSLVYLLAGSPLSGMNDCMAIDADGTKKKVSIRPFFEAWRAFTGINMRYEPCKHMYEAYSLEEVISILKAKQKEDDKLHISGDRLCLGNYIERTRSFSELLKSRKYRKRIIEPLTQLYPEHPNKISELALFLKEKGLEVDAIGTSEREIDEWITKMISIGNRNKPEEGKQEMMDRYMEIYGMPKDKYFCKNYNEVSTLTAKCVEKETWYPVQKDYPELEIGKTYQVSHIGVFRSFTRIILIDFGDKEFDAGCFELFENGESIERTYTDERRFWAPYLRRKFHI